MSLIDRYIGSQILRPLAIALLVALGVFFISRLMHLMDLILGTQGPLKVMFQIIGYLVPQYLSLALPMSLLLGVMIAFNKMSRDGETDALQTAGMGLGRQVRSALLIGAVVSVITGLMHGYLRPYGRYAYEAVVYAVTNAAINASVRAGVFTQIEDSTFFVQGIGADGVSVKRVFLFQEDDDGGTTAIAARDGGLIRPDPLAPPVLRLFDGVRLTIGAPAAPATTENTQESAPQAAPEDAQGPRVLRFQELRTVLGQEQAMMFRPRGIDEREMTINELWRQRDTPPPDVRTSDIIAELNGRIVRTLSVPILPLLAVLLALGRKRTERFAGFIIGLTILIVYEQILDFGKNATESGHVSAVVGLWLPWAVFVGLVLIRFAHVASRVPRVSGWQGRSLLGIFGRRLAAAGPGGGSTGR